MNRPLATLGRHLARLAATIAISFAVVGAAEAHRLKIFVTAIDGEISGHAFFIGGGRPEGVDFVVKDGTGAEVFRGKTDDQGGFRWRPSVAADHTITVDAGDGHWIAGTVSADRLGSVAAGPAAGVSSPEATAVAAAPSEPTTACPAPIDAAALAKIVEREVDKAVARQVRPLIEAQTEAEGRVRFNDVAGGLGMIVGLAGAGLWAAARRRDTKGGGA